MQQVLTAVESVLVAPVDASAAVQDAATSPVAVACPARHVIARCVQA